jgi:hypothetical protein
VEQRCVLVLWSLVVSCCQLTMARSHFPDMRCSACGTWRLKSLCEGFAWCPLHPVRMPGPLPTYKLTLVCAGPIVDGSSEPRGLTYLGFAVLHDPPRTVILALQVLGCECLSLIVTGCSPCSRAAVDGWRESDHDHWCANQPWGFGWSDVLMLHSSGDARETALSIAERLGVVESISHADTMSGAEVDTSSTRVRNA